MKIYENSHALTKIYYNKQLFTLKMSEEDTSTNHVNTFHFLIDNLASDNDSAIVLLGSLSKSHERLVVFISGQPNLTLESVTSLLLQEEIREKSKGRDLEDKPQALYFNKKPFKGKL